MSETREKPSKRFRILWGFDAAIAAIFAFFFFWGLADGTVSSFNIMLWLVILAGLAAVLVGSRMLRSKGRERQATALLLILAIPGILGLVFFLALIVLHPRWN